MDMNPLFSTFFCQRPQLQRYITRYMQLAGEGHLPFKRLMPSPGGALIFDFNGLIFNEAASLQIALVGFHTQSFTFRATANNRDSFIVKFSAYGLSRFISNVPAFSDQVIDARSIFGSSIEDLHKMLANASVLERIALMDVFLMERMNEAGVMEEYLFAITDKLLNNVNIPFKEIRNEVPLGKRQLERRFRDLTGVNISTFRRICRFHKAKEQLPADNTSLTVSAYDGGYYDQAHFSKDFRRIAGVSPNHYAVCLQG